MKLTGQLGDLSMDAKTLAALKASIAKWDANAKAETPGEYLIERTDCPLCASFWHHSCEGCPVFNWSGARRCDATPFGSAVVARRDWNAGVGAKYKAQIAARAEAAFLRSLLPPGETV